MHSHAKHTIHKDHTHHGWNNAFPPKLTIAPGECVEFETLDASSGQLSRTSTAEALKKLDLAFVNPVTGQSVTVNAGEAVKVEATGTIGEPSKNLGQQMSEQQGGGGEKPEPETFKTDPVDTTIIVSPSA